MQRRSRWFLHIDWMCVGRKDRQTEDYGYWPQWCVGWCTWHSYWTGLASGWCKDWWEGSGAAGYTFPLHCTSRTGTSSLPSDMCHSCPAGLHTCTGALWDTGGRMDIQWTHNNWETYTCLWNVFFYLKKRDSRSAVSEISRQAICSVFLSTIINFFIFIYSHYTWMQRD